MGTSLTKAQKAELQATNDLFSGVENTGLENVNSDDLLIPRITILQALSPQLKKSKPEYIPDAEEGDICEVAMGTIIPSPMIFLPVYYKKQWLEWAPRSTGQGLVAVHDSQKILTQCTQDEKGRWFTESGNSIGETAQFFGLNLSSPGRMRCFLPMAASQLRKARKLLTLSTSEKIRRSDGSEFTPPLYYRSYELGICDENNTEGDWKGWTVSRAASLPELDLGVPWSNVLEEATTFLDSLIKGEARGDMSGIGEEGNSSSGAGNQSDTDDSRGM